jgi:hypothetical protein
MLLFTYLQSIRVLILMAATNLVLLRLHPIRLCFFSMHPIRMCLLNPGTNKNDPSPLLQPIRCCRLMPECGQIRQAQYGA